MKVNAKTSKSLVISNALAVGSETSISMNSVGQDLVPITYSDTYDVDWDAANSAWIEATDKKTTNYYKYNVNPEDVDAHTGVEEAAASPLKFGDAINANTSSPNPTDNYYVDYVVYIAASGQSWSSDLKVRLKTNKPLKDDTQRAVTVDFYCATESNTDDATTKRDESLGVKGGTLCFKNKFAEKGTDWKEWATDYATLSVGTIPANKLTSDFLKITMRVYFDGAIDGDRFVNAQDREYTGNETLYTWDDTAGYVKVTGSIPTTDLNSVTVNSTTKNYIKTNTYFVKESGVLVYSENASTNQVQFDAEFVATADGSSTSDSSSSSSDSSSSDDSGSSAE